MKVDVNKVKRFLIEYFEVNTWEECVKMQINNHYDEKTILKAIVEKFPGMFDKMINMSFEYSKIAIEKLNESDDAWSGQYLLAKNKTWYNFLKGLMVVDDVYIMTQFEDSHDVYDVKFSPEEKELVVMSTEIQL